MGHVIRFNYHYEQREGLPPHGGWILENVLVPHMEENKVIYVELNRVSINNFIG